MTPALTRRRAMAGCACAWSALALAGCTTSGGGGGSAPLAPGYRPSRATDEGGLWQAMDKAEDEVRRSRHLIRDPDVNAYVRDVACRLAGDHCPDIRVYVMRTPYFNASMAPNGMMSVWSGLLLRTTNEAQLAAVLGHEIGHYLQRHSINNWRTMRESADMAVFLSLGLAIAGLPAAGELARLLTLASIFAFSREQEREADTIGIELMARAGYAPLEASAMWAQVIAETSAGETTGDGRASGGDVFFASHPAPEEREQSLRGHAAALTRPGQTSGTATYRTRLRGLRATLFDDELRLRRFPKTSVIVQRMLADLPQDPDVHTFAGDLYRLRGDTGDDGRARTAYEQALALPDAPARTWRGYGLVLRRQGDRTAAATAFRHYLASAPDAADRALIESYIGV